MAQSHIVGAVCQKPVRDAALGPRDIVYVAYAADGGGLGAQKGTEPGCGRRLRCQSTGLQRITPAPSSQISVSQRSARHVPCCNYASFSIPSPHVCVT